MASQRTQQPIVSGTSVIGIKFKGGVCIGADTLGSYGSMAKFRDLRRVKTVGDGVLMGCGGEYSDFQYILEQLDLLALEDYCCDDGCTYTATDIYSYLTKLMYQRRNKFNPLWNNLLVAGMKDGEPFLGSVDLIGTQYEDNHIATGFGAHLAMPILRKRWHPDLTEDEAKKLVEDCLRVLYYRDCRAMNRITVGTVTNAGASVDEPKAMETKWDYETFVQTKAGMKTLNAVQGN